MTRCSKALSGCLALGCNLGSRPGAPWDVQGLGDASGLRRRPDVPLAPKDPSSPRPSPSPAAGEPRVPASLHHGPPIGRLRRQARRHR